MPLARSTNKVASCWFFLRFARMPYFRRITKKKGRSPAGENLPLFIHKKLACIYAFLLPFRRKITLFKEQPMRWLSSSLGKKYVMALTGFFLVFFALAHMLGNLSTFGGEAGLNAYAE
ncbi:MAG: hypothetical protein U1D97_06110, partial [Desulfuromonadales bacterium]|nr:hypothetical protein [Desulfuromonadales bacterium]